MWREKQTKEQANILNQLNLLKAENVKIRTNIKKLQSIILGINIEIENLKTNIKSINDKPKEKEIETKIFRRIIKKDGSIGMKQVDSKKQEEK